MVLHAGDMEHVLPDLIRSLEDLRVGQCYPNYYMARLAGRFVRVVLSGSGGDELFGGYPWRYYREVQGDGADGYCAGYYNYWQRLIPDCDHARFFNPRTYSRLRNYDPRAVFRKIFDNDALSFGTVEDAVNASLYFEFKTFLHGLFVVEDKLSMAHSLETRVPFMDNDLVEFALSLPASFKLRDLAHAPRVDENEPGKLMKYGAEPAADGKMILRHAVKRLIPELIDRRKQGFSAPDASWFAGESIAYVNGLLRARDARLNEFLNPAYVTNVLDEHSHGRVNHRLLIWSLLSFEWWCRIFLN
jgi:asparagine synthase (glutamine-hydrolysing)